MTSDTSTRLPSVRVVHLITDLDVGGAETMLARLVTSLDASDIENTVVSLQGGGRLAPEIAARGIEVIALDMRPGRPRLGGVTRLIRTLRTVRPHVLQTWLYHADLLGLVAGTLAGVPALVWNIRASELDFREHPPLLRALIAVLARASHRPSAVVCNSATGRQAHERLGYRPRRWALIPNGVDPAVFRPCPAARIAFRRELGIPPEAPLVGLVARLHPMKDHHTFLRAAAIAAAALPQTRFVLVGRGVADDSRLLALTADLNLRSKVVLLDERRDVTAVFAALDVAVSSSYSEGFPNAVIEAMASGVPCVVTDAGDSAAVVGDTGVVVSPRDPAALAAGMLELLTLPAAERSARAGAARDRVIREYSLARITGQYRSLYEQLAHPGTGGQERICAG